MVELLPDKEDHLILTPYDLISLKDVGLRGGAFAMRELDQVHLQNLLLSDPLGWPPIQVTLCIRGHIVIDGYHRWEAARQLRLKQLVASCQPYQHENEVIEAAFRANLRHGLKASNETRSDYAYWLHITYPQMEQTEIARRAGITQSTVSKAIARREEELRLVQEAEEETTEVMQKRLIKKSCRSFTRGALQFLQVVEELDDAEILQVLGQAVKRQEDRRKLARIGRLLDGTLSH